jgi:hypothetical protein
VWCVWVWRVGVRELYTSSDTTAVSPIESPQKKKKENFVLFMKTYLRSKLKSGLPQEKRSVESSTCGEIYALITVSLGKVEGICQFLLTFL